MSETKRKKAPSRNRFDTRQIYSTLNMNEETYRNISQHEKQTGSNSDYVLVSFAQRLTDCLDQEYLIDIADKLGIAKGSLSEYRSGKTEPRISALAKLAGYFHLSSDYLLGMTDTKTTEPTKKSACEYTGLSDAAIEILHTKGKEKALYSAILSYLVESGSLNGLIDLIEDSLISAEQYNYIYINDSQETNLLDTQEFQFNKKLSNLYGQCMEELSQKLHQEIVTAAATNWVNMVNAARETKEQMERIIESFADLEANALDKRIKKEAPDLGTSKERL